MLVLGVTGDVGAGKSTITQIWKEMGASVIDADDIVRSLWKRPSVIAEAASRWGREILDISGAVIPKNIASKAFGDTGEYKWLCNCLHPLVRVEMERQTAFLEGWIVAEIPLLFEDEVPWWIDATVYVAASWEKRATRNAVRGWNNQEILRRESFLLPSEEKKRRANMILENSGSLEDLYSVIKEKAVFFRRLSSLVQAVVVFSRRDDALLYRSFLKKERLGVEFQCEKVENLDKDCESWCFSFFTRDFFFPHLSLPPVINSAQGPYLHRIRRIPYARRLSISEDLLP